MVASIFVNAEWHFKCGHGCPFPTRFTILLRAEFKLIFEPDAEMKCYVPVSALLARSAMTHMPKGGHLASEASRAR